MRRARAGKPQRARAGDTAAGSAFFGRQAVSGLAVGITVRDAVEAVRGALNSSANARSRRRPTTSTATLDLIGVIVFTVTGVLAASRKEMDFVGFAVLSPATGIGSGTLRDLLLGLTVFRALQPAYSEDRVERRCRLAGTHFCPRACTAYILMPTLGRIWSLLLARNRVRLERTSDPLRTFEARLPKVGMEWMSGH